MYVSKPKGTTAEISTYPVPEVATAGCSKSFNSKYLALFHLRVVRIFDEWHRLSSVNAVLINIVSAEVTDCLDRDGSAIDVHFVAFHGFLDSSTDVTDANVDAGVLESQK